MTIDRFVTIRSTPGSFYSKLPFATTKSAYAWSIGIVCVIGLINSHLLILNGYYEDPVLKNRTISTVEKIGASTNVTEQYLYQNPNIVCYRYKTGFAVTPQWDTVEMFLYSFIPATIMIMFNSLLINTTFILNRVSAHGNITLSDQALAKRRKFTISLLVITFAFILLALPSTIAWGFLYNWISATFPWANLTMSVLDHFSFLNHASVFFSCFLTNYKFRAIVAQYSRNFFSITINTT
jgi:hypothetical protein